MSALAALLLACPLTFAATSLLAVVLGCGVAARSAVPPATWSRNAAAWAVGAVLAGTLARVRIEPLTRTVLVLAPLSLLAGFFASGVSGVHRWIALGPLAWNVAFLTLPAAIVAIASLARHGGGWIWVPTSIIALELCLQPDASQATVFAAAVVAVLIVVPVRTRLHALVGLFAVAMAAVAWTRSDRLQPVAEVEAIFDLANTVSRPLSVLCGAALAAAAASPLVFLDRARPELRAPAAALAAYCLIAAWMPRFGAFPVPLVGMGISPILGFWLGIGALLAYRVPRIDSVLD